MRERGEGRVGPVLTGVGTVCLVTDLIWLGKSGMGLTMVAWGCCCYSQPSGEAGILCSTPSSWLRRGGAPGIWRGCLDGMDRPRSQWHSRRDGVRVGNVCFDRRGWVVEFDHGQRTASVQWVLTSRGQGRERDSKGGRSAKARCNRQSERQCWTGGELDYSQRRQEGPEITRWSMDRGSVRARQKRQTDAVDAGAGVD